MQGWYPLVKYRVMLIGVNYGGVAGVWTPPRFELLAGVGMGGKANSKIGPHHFSKQSYAIGYAILLFDSKELETRLSGGLIICRF